MWAPNCAEWMLAALGLLRAGAVLVPLNTRFKGGEAAYIIRNAGASTLVTVRGFLGFDYPAMWRARTPATWPVSSSSATRAPGPERALRAGVTVPVTGLDAFLQAGRVSTRPSAARAAAVHADDFSDLIFTSGTTGHPKGAAATHAQSLRTFGTWSSIVGLTPGDRYLVVNPFFHTFGYKAGILACLMAGATVVPEPVFDPPPSWPASGRSRSACCPVRRRSTRRARGPRRRARSVLAAARGDGAAIVPVELVQAMRDDLGFDTVLTAYGLTESCGTVTMCRRSDPPEIVAPRRAGPFPASRSGPWPLAPRSRRASPARSSCGATR